MSFLKITKKLSSKYGFTLIEIMITILIIGILSSIALPKINNSLDLSKSNTCLANRQIILDTYEILHLHDDSISLADVLANPDHIYFKNEIQCPSHGTYTVRGNDESGYYLDCSKHTAMQTAENSSTVISYASGLPETTKFRYSTTSWKVDEEGNLYTTAGDLIFLENPAGDEYTLAAEDIQMADSHGGYGVLFDTTLLLDENDTQKAKDTGFIFQMDYNYGKKFIFRERTLSSEDNPFVTIDPNDIEALNYPSDATEIDNWWGDAHDIQLEVSRIDSNQKQVKVYIDGVDITTDEPVIYDSVLETQQQTYAGFRTWVYGNQITFGESLEITAQ